MARMDHNPSSRVSFGLPDDDRDDLDEIADDRGESRSELLRTLVDEFLQDHRDDNTDEPEGFVPRRSEPRTIYLEALDASDENLRLHERHLSLMAQSLNTFNTDGIRSVLQDLRRRGFVSLMGHPPDCDMKSLPSVYRVKPRPVDPEDWTYNESRRRERRDIADLLGRPDDGGECIGHHPNADETDCLKCGARLDTTPDRCACGVPLDDGEDRCPNCRTVADETGVEA
ncbi:ribbon-helix-helix protein, CopG family [Haloarchaeobius sp. HRN-SO-5]|uniref:ribbon-helix-helix protein, CopG family n=1 Tax=Haloarchaeobius sp. HRN-SO-5 TaxID=3446118 RepID=UPI003EB727A3